MKNKSQSYILSPNGLNYYPRNVSPLWVIQIGISISACLWYVCLFSTLGKLHYKLWTFGGWGTLTSDQADNCKKVGQLSDCPKFGQSLETVQKFPMSKWCINIGIYSKSYTTSAGKRFSTWKPWSKPFRVLIL